MRRLASEGVGANARTKTQTLLKDIFKWAKSQGYVFTDPTKNLDPITVPKPNNKDDYFTVDEVKVLLDPNVLASLERQKQVRRASYYHPHLRLLVETGCRPGEMLAIRDPDLHLSETPGQSFVWVRHSRYGDRLKDTKTAAGDRKIPISDALADELRAHLKRRYEYRAAADERILKRGGSPEAPPNPLGFTFTSPWGRPLNLAQFRKVLRKLCTEARLNARGLDDKPIVPHPYTMRRSFLTHLTEAGAPQSAMMALAGHTDFRATQVYLGSTEHARREALDGLWSRLGLDTAGVREPDSEPSD